MDTPNVDLPSYRGYRFPATVISHCVWLYFRFSLSYRDVEEMMAERGVVVSYETIREWCQKFGPAYAKRLRARRGRLGDRWHLDEVFLRINGRLQYLWRAVDQDGEVLDILVQPRRSKQAAKKFFRRSDSGLLSIGAASGSASPAIETTASDEQSFGRTRPGLRQIHGLTSCNRGRFSFCGTFVGPFVYSTGAPAFAIRRPSCDDTNATSTNELTHRISDTPVLGGLLAQVPDACFTENFWRAVSRYLPASD